MCYPVPWACADFSSVEKARADKFETERGTTATVQYLEKKNWALAYLGLLVQFLSFTPCLLVPSKSEDLIECYIH